MASSSSASTSNIGTTTSNIGTSTAGANANINNVFGVGETSENYQKISVDLLISDGQKEKELSPSKNIYQPSGQVTNEVSTTNNLFSQYYATISTIESNKVGINLVYKPFINLLWLSAIMLVFSIFLSVVKKR